MGFNAINFIVNTASILASAWTRGEGANNNFVQNADTSSASAQTATSNTSSYAASYSNSVYSALSAGSQKTISTVEIEHQADYIKDLLNLPRDFQSLINQIQGPDPNAQVLKELNKLLQNGKINLTALSALLGDNSKSAVQKLMMTIMTVSKMGSNNVSQLKELMGMLSGTGGSVDSMQMVKNLLLLYLPWLPLSVRNSMNLDFDIGIFDKMQGSDTNSEKGAEIIKIMIQTANYGNIMATLELSANNEIDVFISAIESFPEKDVLCAFNKENKKSDIRTNVTVEKNKYPEHSEHFKQNIQITSSNYVFPKLILAAHSLIKIIIYVDSEEFIINEEDEG